MEDVQTFMEIYKISFLNTASKLVYLKRTGDPGKYRYWYWHRKLERIVGHPKPEKDIISSHPIYPHHPKIRPREFQVGDIVFHFPKMHFATLIGTEKNFWLVESRLGETFRCKGSSIELVFDNVIGGVSTTIESNLIGAKTQAELDYAERFGQYTVERYLAQTLPKIRIGEATMLRLHRLMFGQVYDWGGKYRKENLVVGRHDSPTQAWETVPDATKAFFKEFSNPLLRQASKSKEHLIEALVEFHKELAWIHPFKDGNGRLTRILAALLALEWNYVLFWDLDSSKKKRHYHYAVRRAVHRENKKYLRSIIEQSLFFR